MPTSHITETAKRVNTLARTLGCPPPLFLNGDPTPEHVDYLDLLPGKNPKGTLLPEAVVEFQERAILYLVDGTGQTTAAEHIEQLQHLLANRGEHACLGIVRPGLLDVYPINLDRQALKSASFKTVSAASGQAPLFFQSLASGTYELEGRPTKADFVFETIHSLLTAASRELAGRDGAQGRLQGLDVLSTTGRALFFRFLVDRRIVQLSELNEICPGAKDLRDTFSTAAKAAATSCWLDETFNGDLLPLVADLPGDASSTRRERAYRDYYRTSGEKTDGRLFLHLQAILRGWRQLGNDFQLPLFDVDWDDLNFAHIPIGVLSQVYESFSHQWDEEQAQETSVHYTPRTLARILVDEAFAGVSNPADAVVLDPACGAGVFLVLAFRRLVHEYWKKQGARPDTRAIQRILYQQLRGFEISESALRLSALALYISAIEVNGTQRPPRSLKFPRPLRGEVLFDYGHDSAERTPGFVLGSLGRQVPVSLNGTFDIVITNPPWTRLRAMRDDVEGQKMIREMNAEFTALSRRALASRGCTEAADKYSNPDNNPDLPFVWRATEWTRPGGIIAMALPARVILKQAGKGKTARDLLLQSLTITGILNGSDLEKTPVWPNMDIPFMLFFARNAVPEPDHCFHFVTPVRENPLSSIGQFRIDYKSSETICIRDVIATPWLLKALGVGTSLDVDVLCKYSKAATGVGDYYERHDLRSGKGYDLAGTSHSTAQLADIKDFEPPLDGFKLIPAQLSFWRERHSAEKAHRVPDSALYDPPLAIVPEAPREFREQPKAYISWRDKVTFSRSNYGYSAARSPDGDLVTALLYLAIHSSLFQHFCLMTSSRQGVSFRTILKEDVDRFPFPDPGNLPPAMRKRVVEFAEALSDDRRVSWEDLDTLVFEVYGLDRHDTTVITDTTAFCGPYRSVRERAEQPVTTTDVGQFCSYLEEMLQPLFKLTDQSIAVRPVDLDAGWSIPAWQFVEVCFAGEPVLNWKAFLGKLIAEANKTGASRVVVRIPKGGLLIGLANQRRFWTRSRAWLCSLHIEQNHLDAFPETK